MSILVKKSICLDCTWKDSCQKLHKLHEMCDARRINPGKPVDVFDVVVINCSLKNFDRSYKNGNEEGMYYCMSCHAMHREQSRIGRLHKKIVYE